MIKMPMYQIQFLGAKQEKGLEMMKKISKPFYYHETTLVDFIIKGENSLIQKTTRKKDNIDGGIPLIA